LVEIIRAVKNACGREFPVWCRIDAKEFQVPGGIEYRDAVRTARRAQRAGADAIHVSAYANPAIGAAFTEAPLVHEPGGYLEFAYGIRRSVSVPVIAVGRIEPKVAEKALADGQADFIAMGRKLLADPELPNKLAEGKPEQIRPCIYCYTCVSQIFLNRQVMCAVNAETGYERDRLLSPAENPRHVLVVGGGPAGMEAARVAALRGHRVTLCEAGPRLGGTVFFASIAYAPNGELIEYLEKQLRELPIEVLLKTTVDEALVTELAADAVILACGARREAPAIPGADQPHVFSGDELRELMTGDKSGTARRKLNPLQRCMMFFGSILGITRKASRIRALSKWWMPVRKRVAIIGGGLVGVELAEFLAERGRRVVLVEEGEKFATELSVVRRWRVLHDLRELGVVMINKASVERIDTRSLEINVEGESASIDADTVILASGAEANRSLEQVLQASGVETHIAGDCGGVQYIEGAMHTGNAAGRAV
jgi:2,4-dienoyl-CoA reductase (NADPH2)